MAKKKQHKRLYKCRVCTVFFFFLFICHFSCLPQNRLNVKKVRAFLLFFLLGNRPHFQAFIFQLLPIGITFRIWLPDSDFLPTISITMSQVTDRISVFSCQSLCDYYFGCVLDVFQCGDLGSIQEKKRAKQTKIECNLRPPNQNDKSNKINWIPWNVITKSTEMIENNCVPYLEISWLSL